MRGANAVPGLALLLALTSGCALNMQKHYQKFRPSLVNGNFDQADNYIEKAKVNYYGKKNRLLYYMDKSVVLHLGKRYKESNAFLEKAKSAVEELWTESIGEHAAAWITTDNSLSYQGEDFEKVLIHFIAALNHIALGDFSAARVEARQIGAKLELYNSKYENKSRSAYTDDAFARWLAGKMAATDGTFSGYNDAWIDYRKAIAIYRGEYSERYGTQVPKYLVQDALHALDALGSDFAEEFETLRSEYPAVPFTAAADAKEMGQIVFIHSAGEAPYKIDQFWTSHAGKDTIRIAYPKFVAKHARITQARMRVAEQSVSSQLAQDVTSIAIENLRDHMGRIKAKAIARAVAKFIAGKAAQNAGKKKGGDAGAALQILGAAWNIGNAVAEQADKRSWITLPAQVNIAQMYVPPGPVSIEVDFLDGSGNVVRSDTFDGQVEVGKTLFLSHRTFR